MCWSVQLLPVRCTNSSTGGAYLDDITDGLRWCVDNGAKTASASYGGVDSSSAGTTGTYIVGKGGLCMWASGNEYRVISGYDHADVIVVGSSNLTDSKSSFSNYGALIDCVAPGEGIWTTEDSVTNDGYDSVSGTSFSTPIVNGVCAMIWAADPSLSNSEVEAILYSTCADIDVSGVDDKTGYGRADMGAAVALAAGSSTAFALIAPSSLTANATATFTVEGASPLEVVYYFYSIRGTGATWVSHLSAFLGINSAVETGSAQADASGVSTFTRVIPSKGAARTVWIQAAVTGAVTNIEQRTIN